MKRLTLDDRPTPKQPPKQPPVATPAEKPLMRPTLTASGVQSNLSSAQAANEWLKSAQSEVSPSQHAAVMVSALTDC